MADLKKLLPPVKSNSTTYYDHSNDPWFKQQLCSSSEAEQSAVIKFNPVPPYLNCAGFVPALPCKASDKKDQEDHEESDDEELAEADEDESDLDLA